MNTIKTQWKNREKKSSTKRANDIQYMQTVEKSIEKVY